jgi:hypothetical protein
MIDQSRRYCYSFAIDLADMLYAGRVGPWGHCGWRASCAASTTVRHKMERDDAIGRQQFRQTGFGARSAAMIAVMALIVIGVVIIWRLRLITG